jgi:DNA invertase Pin-like site-specific DNA recombinase
MPTDQIDHLARVLEAREAQRQAEAALVRTIRDAVDAGVSKSALARELDVNRLTIRRWLGEGDYTPKWAQPR